MTDRVTPPYRVHDGGSPEYAFAVTLSDGRRVQIAVAMVGDEWGDRAEAACVAWVERIRGIVVEEIGERDGDG